MKIALFLEAYLSQASASATHVSLLAEGLVKLGHEVLIVTTDPETDDCYEQDGILCCPAKPSASLFGQSARVSKLPGLMPMIEAFSPDLIHIQTFTEIGGIGLKYAQKHQLPVVCTIHELQDVLEGYGANRPAVLFNKRQGQTLMKKILSGSDVITTASKKCAEAVQALFPCQIHTIPYCVDTERFCPRPLDDPSKESMRTRLHLTDGKVGFVSSGRLSAENRVDDLLAFWSKAVALRDDLRLILVGSGPDAAELHERARVLGIGDKVFFAGSLTRDDLSLCFSVCKAFVSASDSITMEAAPIEAIASGLPVILRPASANADLIISGVNGFSYETPDELGDIVKKLAQLDADGELLMRKLVSKTAASLTDLNQAKALVSCYEMALGRHTQS